MGVQWCLVAGWFLQYCCFLKQPEHGFCQVGTGSVSAQASEEHVCLQIPSNFISFSLYVVLVVPQYEQCRCFTLTGCSEILF